jgi:hypothetical protein
MPATCRFGFRGLPAPLLIMGRLRGVVGVLRVCAAISGAGFF